MSTTRKPRNHRKQSPLCVCYAAAGNTKNTITQLTWPDTTKIDYSYSQHNELQSVVIPGEGSISVSQFKWLAPAKVTLPGGTAQERTLDGLLNLEGLKVKTPGQQTVLSVANTYGKVQELKTNARVDTAGNTSNTGNISTSKTSTYSYDDEIRLTQVKTDAGGLFGNDTETFTLDAVGNRIAHSKTSGAWVYDANNRLTQRGTGSCGTGTTNDSTICYQYDALGNQTQKTQNSQTTQYSYDTQNRLIEVADITAGQSATQRKLIARYGYDPLDRRIWKEQYADQTGTPLGTPLTQAQRTLYLYADEGLIAEATQNISLTIDASGVPAVTASINAAGTASTPAITTQYGPRPNSEFGTGVLFIKTKNSNSTEAVNQSTVAYYHHDQLQTPLQATDKAGNIVWAASFDAFGKASIITPAATSTIPTIASNLRLPGQYEDVETGLHYNYRRYYDTQTGRYMTQDPIGLLGGVNRFVNVGGDPVNIKDPTGLWATYVHTRAGYLAFGNEITRSQLKLIADAQFYADSHPFQSTDNSFRHAMSKPKQDDACKNANDFVHYQFEAAARARRSGNMDLALREFGIGLHTLQDSTSRAHRGFQTWEGHPWYHYKSIWHGVQELNDFNPGTSDLDRMTRNAWSAFKDGRPAPSMSCGC